MAPSQSRKMLFDLLKLDSDKIWGWILLIIPPLAVAGPFASLTPGKAGSLYALRVVILLLLFPALIAALRDIRKSRTLQLFSAFVIAFLAWSALTLAWTASRKAGKTEVMAMASSMLAGWVLLALTRGRSARVKMVLIGWFISTLMSIAVSAVEIFTGFHPVLIGTGRRWDFYYCIVAGTFANPNNYASYVIGMFMVSGCLALVSKSVLFRLICYATLPVLALFIVGTRSRGCEAGLVVGGGILLIMAVVELAQKRFLAIVMFIAVAASIGIGVGLESERLVEWNYFANPGAIHDLPVVDPNAPKPSAEHVELLRQWESDKSRIQLIKRGLHYFKEKPLHGHGAGSFVTLTAQDPKVSPVYPKGMNAHNMFLQVMVHYGLPGIVLVLAIFNYALIRLFKGRYGKKFFLDPTLYLGLGLFLGLMLSALLAADMIGLPVTWPMFATILALGWGRWPQRNSTANSNPVDRSSR